VWGLSGPTPTVTLLTGHTGWITASFSPDGSRIVTASEDNSARVWDLSEPTPKVTLLTGHTGWVRAANFSPDGTRIVTASRDKTARVWDLSGGVITTLIGHTDRLIDASFSPDGTRIVTASTDKTARVWDLSGLTATFSLDGPRDVTASADGAVGDYAFPELGDLMRETRNHLPRCLTRAQWVQFGVATREGDTNTIPAPDAQGRCPR
jgi:WD40 repeat protein